MRRNRQNYKKMRSLEEIGGVKNKMRKKEEKGGVWEPCKHAKLKIIPDPEARKAIGMWVLYCLA